MATGRSMQLTKQVGEYLVSAELCRLEFITTTFTGNVPEFDILAINKKLETKTIQVKTIRGGNWQFNVRQFLNISISSDGVQTISGKKDLLNPNLICIFVKLVSQGKDEFYVFRLKGLQQIIYAGYSGWLGRHGGRRPRNPQSMLVSVSPSRLSECRDNWKLLKE